MVQKCEADVDSSKRDGKTAVDDDPPVVVASLEVCAGKGGRKLWRGNSAACARIYIDYCMHRALRTN